MGKFNDFILEKPLAENLLLVYGGTPIFYICHLSLHFGMVGPFKRVQTTENGNSIK